MNLGVAAQEITGKRIGVITRICYRGYSIVVLVRVRHGST